VSLERRSPLPVGRYWVDVPSSKSADFEGYLQANAARIHVEGTEAGEPLWFLFSVSEPVPWFAVNFGYPTIAAADVKSKADTAERPDLPKDGSDQVSDALESVGSLGQSIIVAAAIGGALVLLSKFVSRRGK
jgi:hypothetical protein